MGSSEPSGSDSPGFGKWNLQGNWKRFKEKSTFYSIALTKRLQLQSIDRKNDSSISHDKAKCSDSKYPIMERKFKLLKNNEPFEMTVTEKSPFVRGSHLRSPVRMKRKEKSRKRISKDVSEDSVKATYIKQTFGFLPMWKKIDMPTLSSAKSSPTLSSSSFTASLNATASFTRLSELTAFLIILSIT